MKNPKHLRFISTLACMICGNPEVQVHHLLRAEPTKGMGRKQSDKWALPLCVTHHDMLHRNGDEIGFFADQGISYESVKKRAEMLWNRTLTQ